MIVFKTKDNIVACLILVIAIISFFAWGYNSVDSDYIPIFFITALFGIFMAFNIGGNDVANAFGTSVGAKTLTIKQALVIAAVFELSGAVFAGAEVTSTIRSGIISFPADKISPMQLVAVMMSALFSASLWLFFATKKGLPVSTTHSIVGGIVGGGIMMGYINFDNSINEAVDLVHWTKIESIVLSWVVSPLLGAVIAYIIFVYIQKTLIKPSIELSQKLVDLKSLRQNIKQQMLEKISNDKDKSKDQQIQELKHIILTYDDKYIIDKNDSANTFINHLIDIRSQEKQTQKKSLNCIKLHIPLIAMFSSLIVFSALAFKGLKNLDLQLTQWQIVWILFAISLFSFFASLAVVNIMKYSASQKKIINRIFGWFQLFTASAFAFSHGANDIANAIGPFSAVLEILRTGQIADKSPIPTFALIVFGIALVLGLWVMGKEVINTVGTRLAHLEPYTGFVAELSASSVILIATMLGLPISSTHVLIGAVLGIGLYNKDANLKMIKPILLAWLITLPIAIVGAAIGFLLISKFVI